MRRLAPIFGVAPADLLLLVDGGLDFAQRALADAYRDASVAQRAMFDGLSKGLQPYLRKGETQDSDD